MFCLYNYTIILTSNFLAWQDVHKMKYMYLEMIKLILKLFHCIMSLITFVEERITSRYCQGVNTDQN